MTIYGSFMLILWKNWAWKSAESELERINALSSGRRRQRSKKYQAHATVSISRWSTALGSL